MQIRRVLHSISKTDDCFPFKISRTEILYIIIFNSNFITLITLMCEVCIFSSLHLILKNLCFRLNCFPLTLSFMGLGNSSRVPLKLPSSTCGQFFPSGEMILSCWPFFYEVALCGFSQYILNNSFKWCLLFWKNFL